MTKNFAPGTDVYGEKRISVEVCVIILTFFIKKILIGIFY